MIRIGSHTVVAAMLVGVATSVAAAPTAPASPEAVRAEGADETTAGANPNPRAGDRPEAHAAAQAALVEGNRLFNDGDFDGAIAAYRRVQAMLPAAAGKLEFNIGKAEAARGNQPAAATAFERFLSATSHSPAEFGDEARSELARLAGGLGALKLAEQKPDLVVSVDGEVRGTTPLPDVWVRPGHHTLTLTEGDRLVFRDDFQVEAGASVQVAIRIATTGLKAGSSETPASPPTAKVDLQPAAASAATTSFDAHLGESQRRDDASLDRPLWKRWWFWAASAAVVVGTVATVVLLTRHDRCPSGYDCENTPIPSLSP